MLDETVQPTSKGVRVSGSNTPTKILSQLPDSGRGWYILKPNDYPTEIRSNSYLKIFNKKGRSETRGSRSDRDYIYVFEKLRPVGNGTGGGGGGGSDKGKFNNLDICAMCIESSGSQLNTDPAVFITNPKKDSTVVRGTDGVEADGSAYDSKSVALSWLGGSESKDVSNDAWKITLPLGVGEHELTAVVEGDTKSAKFTVILKPELTGYTAEQIQALKTYSNNAKISEVEQDADTLAREAGLKEITDDYAGFAICRKVNDFASKASGDFSLFYSGSGDKGFIEKKIDRIFGSHLTVSKKTALITKLEAMKTVGFVDATDEFHDAMKNTLDIFFAENSVGKTISELNVPIGVNPAMILVMDTAKTVVNIKLNIQLGLESNGAPLLMRQEARRNAFDAIAVEVAGAAVGGVVIKASSKSLKVIKTFFKKNEYRFKKKLNDKMTRNGSDINDKVTNKVENYDENRFNTDTVFSGHGYFNEKYGTTKVPENATLTFYSEHGSGISDHLGNAIEHGDDLSQVYKRKYGSGDEIPNYILGEPEDLIIKGKPITVDKPTLLSDLIKPNMGDCHFAACTNASDVDLGTHLYDIDGIIDTEQKIWLKKYD